MAYFQIKNCPGHLQDLADIRKNNAHKLQTLANSILRNNGAPNGIEFAIQGKVATATEYANAVLAVIDENQAKYDATHKRIWIQQGVCSNSGYYKSVKL